MDIRFDSEWEVEIERLAAIKGTTNTGVLRRALTLYRLAIDETMKGSKLALVEGDGLVLKIINVN